MKHSENFGKILGFLKIWMMQNEEMDPSTLKSDFRAMKDALDLMGCCSLITAGEEAELFDILNKHIKQMQAA